MITFLVTAFALFAWVLWRHGNAIYPITLTVLTMLFMMGGFWLLDMVADSRLWHFYALSIAAVIAGYQRIRLPVVHRLAAITDHISPNRRVGNCIFVGLVLALVVYHFSIIGIPLLQPDVEVSRWNFSGSGLFGLPGRAFIFGLPFCALFATLQYTRDRTSASRWLRVVSWAAYALAQIGSGFKGSIINVFATYVLARAVTGAPVRIRTRSAAKYVLATVVTFGFAGVVASRYTSVGVTSVPEALTYLGMRMTTIASEAGYYALTELPPHPDGGSYNLDDLSYFSGKYFGFLGFRSQAFPLDKRVSSSLTGTDLGNDDFVVSVTLGGPPSVAVDTGKIAACALMFLAGLLYGYAFRRASESSHAFVAAMWALSLNFVSVFLMNGGFFYGAINLAAMGILLATLYWIAHLAGQIVAPTLIAMRRRQNAPTPAAHTAGTA